MTVPNGCFAQIVPDDGGTQLLRVTIPAVEEATATIGSGDAFLAGYVAARYAGRTAADCLAYGVACGAESTKHLGAGVVEPDAVDRLLGQVEVTPVAGAEVP